MFNTTGASARWLKFKLSSILFAATSRPPKAAIDSGVRILPGVAQVVGQGVGSLPQRDYLAGRDGALGRTIGARELAKVVVKAKIFFDDEDDVLDLAETDAPTSSAGIARLITTSLPKK